MKIRLPKGRLPHAKHQWALGHYYHGNFDATSTWVCWCGAIRLVTHPSVLYRVKRAC